MKKLLLLLVAVTLMSPLMAQVVTTAPALPTDADQITVVFDATQGSGGLEGYTGDVYAHTGVITSASTGSTDWKYVIADWDENTTKAKMTALGNDKYELVIGPSIREFYAVPDGETIQQVAFVFRSADGSATGKTAANGDIFVDVYEGGLAISITSPVVQPFFVDANSTFNLVIAGSESTSTTIKIDGSVVHTETVSPNSFTYTVNTAASGTHEIVVEATDGSSTVTDNFTYAARSAGNVEALPANVRDGINYIDDNTITLVLHAPYKNSAYVFGSFNDWKPMAMNRNVSDVSYPDLRYWITITGLEKGKEYIFQYLLDEEIKIADPYSEKISDPWNDGYIDNETYPDLIAYPAGKTDGVASVVQTAQTSYTWQVNDFTPPKNEDLVIYELLVRDFAAKANYQTLIDTIGYFKRLGVNAIELMPTNEFEGNDSWGYNPSFYFAPDKAYGTKNKMKEFIDVCHQNGIAVYIDLVLNHSYGLSPFVQMYFDKANNRPAPENLWYNTTNNFQNPDAQWGYDFNHDSRHTRALVDSINSFWLKEYKVDGFRFDFTKGFSNTPYGPSDWGSAYDAARIANLKRMADEIWKRNPNAYISFEHLSDNSEEKELAAHGIYLWGNMNHNYGEGTMGYVEQNKSDLSWGTYTARNWSSSKLVTYMESHDEERLMFKNQEYGKVVGSYSTKDTKTALSRMGLAAAFLFTIPGPKMIWQFGELGYDVSINEGGRTSKKPVKWEYYDDADRFRLFQIYSALIKLKTEQDVFETTDFTTNLTGEAKSIHLNGADMDVTIIGNFDVIEQSIDPNFQQAGTWYDYYTSESVEIADVNAAITLQPGEYHIYTSVQLPKPDINLEEKPNSVESLVKSIDVKAYPNPVTEKLNITFNLDDRVEDAKIEIINIQGKVIETLHSGVLAKGQHQINWNVDNNKVAKGMYLLKINSNTVISNKVLIVE